MANNESTTKFRADISQLKSAMQQAQREVKLANAQFKAAASSMDDWSKTSDGLQAKLKQLTTVQGAQRKQLALLENELELTVKEYGEGSKEADNLRIRIENQKAALNNTTRQLDKYSKELDDAGKETDQLGDESKQTSGQVKNLSDGFTTAKAVLANLVASGIKAAITGLKNLAGAAKDAYEEFDKGADAVIKATGATGEAAAALTESYNNVAHNVVGDMGDIGSALGEINTRFGYTGTELEDATERFMKFADITGTDATEAVRLVSRALENSGMDAKEYGSLLDMLAKAGQASGVSVSTLAENITKMGPQMRQLGYSTQESIAMFAQFEKEGVNSETVLAGLKKAVAFFGKEGVNATLGFQRLVNEIKNTPDVAKASELAIEAFGSKAGPELVDDIQAGKLEYQDFLDVLKDSEGTVTDTYEATQDGFDKVKLAIQGGKADLGAFVREIATEYQDDIVETVNKIKDAIKTAIRWVVQNAGLIIETIKSIVKVMATLWAVKKAAAFANVINGVITALKGMATATAAATTATTAMNGASGILASLVSPGGAIVLGITAIVAVTASLISIFKEEEKEIDVLTEAEKESIQASADMRAEYEQMEASRKEAIASVKSEYAHYEDLLAEFDQIVDGNGKVKAGYEERAQFIMNTLNQALGMEMTMQDGIIKNYEKERQSINQLLETKKAEAVLASQEAAYTEAVQKKQEAVNTYVQAQETANDVLKRAEAQAVEVQKVYMEMARIESEEGINAAKEYQDAHEDVFKTYQALQSKVTDTKAALLDATTAYEGYNQTIEQYEGLSSAIIGGDAVKINEALLKTEAGLKTHTSTTADQLKIQRDTYKNNYELLKKAMAEGDKKVTQQQVDDAKKLAELAAKEYELSGKNTVAGYAKGLKDDSHYAEEAAKQMGYNSYADFNASLGINSPSTKTYASGEFFAQGFINGMGSKDSAVYLKAKALAQRAIQGLKDGQKEGSPSKITTQSGKYFTEGYMNGIGSMSKDLILEVKRLAEAALDAMGGTNMINKAKAAAAGLMSGSALSFGDLGGIRAAVAQPSAGTIGGGRSVVNNNYNLVQNNNSPKALTALETYQARRQQVAMLKAMM